MAEILPFPTEAVVDIPAEQTNDGFLLDEGLDLLNDFRSIDDRLVRDSVRGLVRSLALASGKIVTLDR